jgi:hypothetical protein
LEAIFSEEKSPGNAGGRASGWPRAVAEVAERRPTFARALERWRAARERLGLGADAERVGALLLGAQLDERAYRALIREQGLGRGLTRSALVAALRDELGEEAATQALLQLEERAVARALDDPARPWFGAEVALDGRVRAHCLAGEAAPSRAPQPLGARQVALVARAREAVKRLGARRLTFVIRGGAGTGRDTLLAALVALDGAGGALLVRSCYDLRGAIDPLEPELGGAAAVWDARGSDPSPEDYHLAARWLARGASLAVALLDGHQDAPEVPGRQVVLLESDAGPLDERVHAWRQVLLRAGASEASAAPAAALLARRSRAGVGLAARAADMRAPLPAETGELVLAVEEALGALARPSSTRGLVVERPEVPLARVIASDLVGAALDQLLALARLYPELGSSGRRGVKALFAGPSGTGKTLAARAVATELCLPLYRVDLSTIVSKWVGETEKNLRHALEAAESAGALLLFDEGDALMAKRGEVTRGTDRYANLEVSYLLQAIEAHDGIVVVTTNLRANLDSAFLRRFDVSVEFAPPSRQARALLWAQELGAAGKPALGGALLADLSSADLTGGNIAAAARLALALAHRRGEENVSGQDLCAAVAAEMLKLASAVQAAQWLKLGKEHAR